MTTIYRDAGASALPLYRDALDARADGTSAAGQIYEFPLSPLDRLGLPLWTVALIGEDGALSDGFGYGANLEAAQTSAWGECVEWYYAREALRTIPRVRGTLLQMQTAGRNALDPRSLCLAAGDPYNPATYACDWVEARQHPSGESVWLPIEFVAPRAADIGPGLKTSDLLSVPITNGLGAGPTHAHALAHGVLELLQRDGNCVNYRAMDRGIRVELDEVQDPQTRELLQFLDEAGIEVIVKLAATDFGMVNLYVVGYDRDIEAAPQPISLSACGESVHPDREFALAKALREFVMARARKAFNHGPLAPIREVATSGYLESFRPASMRSEDDRALRDMQRWSKLSHAEFFEMLRVPIFETKATVRFSELPTVPYKSVDDAETLLNLLTERLGAGGLNILAVDFTPSDAPVQVLRAIVPGLEVETMTYNRIGTRNVRRLRERQSSLVSQDVVADNELPVRLLPQVEAEQGPAYFSPAEVERIVGPLYALYREPGRHVVAFLEEGEKAQGSGEAG